MKNINLHIKGDQINTKKSIPRHIKVEIFKDKDKIWKTSDGKILQRKKQSTKNLTFSKSYL